MKRLLFLLILFVNLQIVIIHEDMRIFSYSTVSAQHMTKEAGDNCYDETDHLWYHVDVASDCNDYGIVSTPCHYCWQEFGMDIQARDRHEESCGRELDVCDYCGERIQRKDMMDHYRNCPVLLGLIFDLGFLTYDDYKNSQNDLIGEAFSWSGSTHSVGGYGGSGTSNSSHYFYIPPNTPVEYEGALIADFCYDNRAHWDDLHNTYHYQKDPELEASLNLIMEEPIFGFKCDLLVKKSGGKIVSCVLAFAGTSPYSLTNIPFTSMYYNPDIIADLWQLIFGMGPQYAFALENAKKISGYCKENDIQLTFVGHSLGGGLAALSSMATGSIAITYNPAALSNRTIKYLIDHHYSTDTSKILQYIVQGEPINFFQNFITPSQGNVKYVTTEESQLFTFMRGHFMSTVIFYTQ